MQVFSNQGMDEMSMDMQNALGGLMPRKQKKRKVTIAEAKKIFTQEEAQNLIDRDSLTREAIQRAEQSGIIFVDEIDKIAGTDAGRAAGAARTCPARAYSATFCRSSKARPSTPSTAR